MGIVMLFMGHMNRRILLGMHFDFLFLDVSSMKQKYGTCGFICIPGASVMFAYDSNVILHT